MKSVQTVGRINVSYTRYKTTVISHFPLVFDMVRDLINVRFIYLACVVQGKYYNPLRSSTVSTVPCVLK